MFIEVLLHSSVASAHFHQVFLLSNVALVPKCQILLQVKEPVFTTIWSCAVLHARDSYDDAACPLGFVSCALLLGAKTPKGHPK